MLSRSLDALIGFLLDEIALSGEQGVKPADILGFIDKFYTKIDDDQSSSENEPGPAGRPGSPTIDRAFQEQVWKWLTRHPDVLVGKDRSDNGISLTAAEAQYTDKIVMTVPGAVEDASTSSPFLSHTEQRLQIHSDNSPVKAAESRNPVKVYVTEERRWLAICGHPKDLTKVFETEFVLLSVIAANRENGILQGDLVKESGQDKRSVPKRTDLLRDKGYIEKRNVQLRSSKTSWLVLGRFASSTTNDLTTTMPIWVNPDGNAENESVDFHILIQSIFAALKEKPMITLADLKKQLDMTTRWRARVLSKVVCKLEHIGCLKRVRAASEASKNVRLYFYCVKLIHEPSEKDLTAFYAPTKSQFDEQAVEEKDPEDEDEADQVMLPTTMIAEGSQLQEVGRIVPHWNPDRSFPNAVRDLIHASGVQGLTNKALRQQYMGAFVRRPLEHLTMRLTGLWRQSQPLFLRHLAIVRDKILSGTLPLYVQYSLPNFEARVESGQAFWEAVKSLTNDKKEKGKKVSTKHNSSSYVDLELDEFGYPAGYKPVSQYKCGRATLVQTLLAAHPDDLPVRNRDPVINHNTSGAYTVGYAATETKPRSRRPLTHDLTTGEPTNISSAMANRTIKPAQTAKIEPKPLGRPRKFLRGTEKFWRGQFALVQVLANPRKASLVRSKAGVMTDPAGLSLFAKRPPQFDPTLLRALDTNLPVPANPEDVTQEWVDVTLAVLDRFKSGVYITPKGTRFQEHRKHKGASRILIIRSSRLAELDLSRRRKVPPVRFLVSSAAHTFTDISSEFLGETVDVGTRTKTPNRDISTIATETQDGLHDQEPQTLLGTQCENPVGGGAETRSFRSPTRQRRKTAKKKRCENVPTNEVSTSSIQQSEDTSKSKYLPSLDLFPPVTKRSKSRKVQSAKQSRPEMIGARGDLLATAVDNRVAHDEQNGPSGPSRPQSPLPKISALPSSANSDLQPQKQTTPAPIVQEPSSDDVSTRSAILHNVPDVLEQAPDITMSQTPDLTPPRPQSTLPGLTIDTEELASVPVDHGLRRPESIGEETSEAYRLIQELTRYAEDETANTDDGDKQPAMEISSLNADGKIILPALSISQIDSDGEPPHKRAKHEGIGAGSIGILRRKIVLDLLETCSGALPYCLQPLLNAFRTAWQKAGQSGKPDIRTIKATVKSLCQNGGAKQVKFSHRNKKGAMVTKTILAKVDMTISDPVLLATQKNMIEADPHQYVPHGLEVDFEPTQASNSNPRLFRRWPKRLDDETVETSEMPMKVYRDQLRETLALARSRRQQKKAESSERGDPSGQQHSTMAPPARLGNIKRRYRKGSEVNRIPKLSMRHYRPQPQLSFSDQLVPESSQGYRTEIAQRALTFETIGPDNFHNPKQRLLLPHGEGRAGASIQFGSMKKKRSRQQIEGVPVVWRKIRGQPIVPSSVEDIILDDRRRVKPDFEKEVDPNYRKFEWIIDGVALWEQRSMNLLDSRPRNVNFINHSVGNNFYAAPGSETTITFDGLLWYDQRGKEHTERRFHPRDHDAGLHIMGEGYVDELEQPGKVFSLGQSERFVAKRAPRKRKRDSIDSATPKKRRRRGKSPLTQPQTITDAAGNLIDVSYLIGAKYKRPRGTQHLRTMPEHLIYKLTVTVVVIRALAGGLEKHVDWSLVMHIFPDEEENFLRDRWKTLSNKHRRDIEQLSENFQEKFPDAYARGEVPQINFEDLESVDWESLVQWALSNLDKPIIRVIPDLPATRSELDQTVNMKLENSHKPYRELFNYNQSVTVPTKEAAISAIPFAVPLPSSPPFTATHSSHLPDPAAAHTDDSLTLAKSWTLSTITASLSTFKSAPAQTKLQSLLPTAASSDNLIASALKSLIGDRSIIKNRATCLGAAGRRYDLSRIFTDALDARRSINARMLKQAVHYKRSVLDPAFRAGDAVEFVPLTVEDGDMVAILNLAASGRVEIRAGDDVPRNRWGIDHENSRYQTRNIKKEILYFTVLVRPVPGRYLVGNPLLVGGGGDEDDDEATSKMAMPALGTAARDRIPIWRSIHAEFQQGFWDMAVAAVLGILASRAGASVWEVAKMMQPALTGWEVECLLEWGLRVGVVKKTGEGVGVVGGGWSGGWEVREWWWMALECGRVEESGRGGD